MQLPLAPLHSSPIHRIVTLAAALAFLGSSLAPAADTPAAPPAGNASANLTATPPPPATPAQNTAIVPVPRNASWVKRHDGFVELAKKGDIDVLFLGDSITDYWRDNHPGSAHQGAAVWKQYYGDMKAANFGISADRTQHVLWRLQNGEGQGFKPKVIVLLIGTNNTGLEKPPSNTTVRNTTEEATAGVIAVVQELRKDFPDSKILLLGIFPRGDAHDPQRAQIDQINAVISKLNDDQHIFYLYFGDKFLGPDGNIPKDVMADALHPTTKGYAIWAEAMKEPLAKLLGTTPVQSAVTPAASSAKSS